MDPEKLKRLLLAVLLAVAVVFITFTALIQPTKSEIEQVVKEAEDLNAKLRKARGMQNAIDDLEKKLAAAQARADEIFRNQPKGAPLASVPPQIEGFFARQGVKAIVRSAGSPVPLDSKAPQFQIYGWEIEIAAVDFIKFGTALAAFENSYPLAQVNILKITPSSENPELQACQLKIFNIIRQ